MADNIDITPGTGKTIAGDDIAGVLHQRVKISQGADGSATDVSSSAPLQVTVANTGSNAVAIKVDNSAVTQPVSGTVTSNIGTGSLAGITGTVTVKADTAGNQTNALKVDGSATTQPVSGTFYQATQPVSGTFYQATQPVSGNLGVTSGSAVPASGASTAVTTQLVDGSGNQITSFGGGTQFADGAARGTATGTIAMVDDGTNIQSLSGDSTGKLNVNNISGTVSLPTGASTETTLTAIKDTTGIKKITDAVTVQQSTASSLNAQVVGDVGSGSADSGNPVKVGGKYNATMPTLTDGQRGDTQLTTRGAIKTTLFANDSTTTIRVFADNADAVATTSTGNALGVVNRNTVYNGTTWDRMPGDATNGTWVNVKAGTVTAAQNTASSLNATVVGQATGSAIPATAFPAGFQARTTDPTATTSTYNTIGIADAVGKLVVMPYAIKENFVKGSASATSTASTAVGGTIIATVGIKNYITGFSVANTGTTASLVTLQDGNAGTAIWRTIAPASSGSNFSFPTPIATSANTALYFACGTASTTIYISVTGYTGV